MPTQNDKEAHTTSNDFTGDTLKAAPTQEVSSRDDTHSAPPQKTRTVRASTIEESVRLRYIPRAGRPKTSDSTGG